MKNIIQFRNGFINLPINQSNTNTELAYTVNAELMQFGYYLDNSALDQLISASREDIVSFHNEIITYLKDMTGSNRTYKPFWKGFPQEVMEKSECHLWFAQLMHYASNGTWAPNDWTAIRPTAFEQPKYTSITAGDETKFLNIFRDLLSVNQSLTPDDLKTVEWFVDNVDNLVFPDVIPFKENLCTLGAMGVDVPVKTVTDVLRIAVRMSGGDISLPKVPAKMVKLNWWEPKSVNVAREAFKFKKFPRSERRHLLGLLEKTNCDASEAVLKDNRWIRLGEILHPGEYKKAYPKASKMFDLIRNEKVKSFYSKVNTAFKNALTTETFEGALSLLATRPGEFMRRLDWLVRTYPFRIDLILSKLKEIAPSVSNKVLYEIYSHFEKRNKPSSNRMITIKGSRQSTKLPDLPNLSNNLIEAIQKTVIDSLSMKFSALPELGYVYIDEQLKNIPLPTNMRSVSSALKPRVRGIRVPIGNQNANTIRAFVHWFDEHGTQDIDLTATFIGMGKMMHIGWNGHKVNTCGTYSGDVRHIQGACAEYIDIDVKASLREGYKYVLIDARNYNGGSFESITDCVFGWMEREFPEANEVFVPATLANTVRLTNQCASTLVAMIDVETQEYIFLDIDQSGIPVASANFNTILDALKPYMEPPKFSVYHLLKLHAVCRGKHALNPEEADIEFTFDQFADSYVETLKYMGI